MRNAVIAARRQSVVYWEHTFFKDCFRLILAVEGIESEATSHLFCLVGFQFLEDATDAKANLRTYPRRMVWGMGLEKRGVPVAGVRPFHVAGDAGGAR
jgi:hypothetical protein